MKAILNRKFFDIKELPLSSGNRAFKYGDGLFETIAAPKGTPRLLNYHLQRLEEGAEYLNLDVKEILKQKEIESAISQLQELNNIKDDAIIKLHVWRNAEGRYAVDDSVADLLITLEKTAFSKINIVPHAHFSEKTINYPSGFSQYKTMNALKYVIAGIEKKEKGLDEIIILDHNGHVSEALSSNIYWKKDKHFFTPPLSTGCISGVMRRWITEKLHKNGYRVEEKLIEKDEFQKSDCIFTSNATGIGHIKSIGEYHYNIDPVSQNLIELIS